MSATIPADYKPRPLSAFEASKQFVSPDGRLTLEGLRLLNGLRDYVNGGSRIIPCSASGKNLITLTPNDASPLLEGYRDYDVFAFTASETSDASVTATVVPKTGALATLKVYTTAGAAQAGSGDVVANSVYWLCFADHLDAAAGGLVLK